jgi:hypothetical protein
MAEWHLLCVGPTELAATEDSTFDRWLETNRRFQHTFPPEEKISSKISYCSRMAIIRPKNTFHDMAEWNLLCIDPAELTATEDSTFDCWLETNRRFQHTFPPEENNFIQDFLLQ